MNKTTLLIVRHGNTFTTDQTPTRVGARTDLPLVESGRTQAKLIGKYLKENNMLPDIAYSSHLIRAKETASLALVEIHSQITVQATDIFNEIDYGPDENKPEKEVIARIGEQAIKDWDEHGKVPDGWRVDPQTIIQNWHDFAARCLKDYADKTILVVTSNGIARFAPYLTGDFAAFRNTHKIKISTGALCVFEHTTGIPNWTCTRWNIRPN